VNYLINYEAASVVPIKNKTALAPIENKPLTTRQHEIFDLIVLGKSNKEIARKLALSMGTVKIHIASLFDRLGVHHRGGVALAGAKLGLRLPEVLDQPGD
jgi:DNA-binding NarL/FixJ family response regulator